MHIAELTVRKWSETEFYNNKKEWQQLLTDSESDQLFLSWGWMTEWWSIWGKNSPHTLSIFAAYDREHLVGIAPLYLTRDTIFKGVLPVKRLQFIGTRYRGSSGIRSENLEFIARADAKDTIIDTLFSYINDDKTWDELILSDLIVNEATYRFANSNNFGYHARITRSEISYLIDCMGSFDAYLANLGKNTRLKMYNRRKLLEKHGEVTVEYIPYNKINEVFETMNYFHQTRWSSKAFKEPHEKILRRAMIDFEHEQNTTHSSILKVDGKPLSVLMNLFANRTIYNIQLGYMENFDKKISLGTLHLGYAVEDAFRSEYIDSFNLLAGAGKNSDYKAHIAGPSVTLESRQMVRRHLLKLLYLVNDRILRRFKEV